jgi:large subunit ribosomal protein L15
MNLSSLKPPKGQVKKGRRVGQGMGTGRGKFSGRGAKGARSISGYSKMRGFEGGQMPLHRRMPKRGFTNIFKKEYAVLNVGRMDGLEGDTFTPETLAKSGIIKKLGDGLKILAGGELKRAIHVEAHLFSEEAEKKILAAGGTVKKIEIKVTVTKPRGTGKQAMARKTAAAKPRRAKA